MFKRLFCKHQYKYYNTVKKYLPFGIYRYNVLQFVCTECGKTTEVWVSDINMEYEELESSYRKHIALGGESIETKKLSIPCGSVSDIGTCYISPTVTLLVEKYLKRGIDLRQLNDL